MLPLFPCKRRGIRAKLGSHCRKARRRYIAKQDEALLAVVSRVARLDVLIGELDGAVDVSRAAERY